MMEYRVKYVTPDGSKVLYGYAHGRTEDECWEDACRRYGRANIFDFVRV